MIEIIKDGLITDVLQDLEIGKLMGGLIDVPLQHR
jgi:hypothetical protein